MTETIFGVDVCMSFVILDKFFYTAAHVQIKDSIQGARAEIVLANGDLVRRMIGINKRIFTKMAKRLYDEFTTWSVP